MELHMTNKRHMRVKLIFNPSAGATRTSPVDIVDVIHEMQTWKLVPEAYLVEPGCDLPGVVKDALAQGFHMFVVCGGDGTISAVARTLAGTRATLGIIPIGTQNNTALSLGIPSDVPAAIAILRTGRRIKVDVGMATCGKINTPFLEVCSVGLVSTLFSSVDDIQHGNLARVGDFLSTLAASPPAEIHLLLDDKQEIHNLGHVVLVSNMPFIGFHYQLLSKMACWMCYFLPTYPSWIYWAMFSKEWVWVNWKTPASSIFVCTAWISTPTLPCRSWPMGMR
jgi:diacylglycerol kinase family enzyme